MICNRSVSLPNSLALASLAALANLVGCEGSAPTEASVRPPEGSLTGALELRTRTLAPQAVGLQAGAAETSADLPIGTPLAAYTERLHYSGLATDRRTSPYTTEFSPSSGHRLGFRLK